MRRALAVLALLALAACGHGTDATGATPDEARQLNEAAAMLDANSVDANIYADTPATGPGSAGQPRQDQP